MLVIGGGDDDADADDGGVGSGVGVVVSGYDAPLGPRCRSERVKDGVEEEEGVDGTGGDVVINAEGGKS